MNWIKINERILELEQKDELNEEEEKEWKRLIGTKIAGVLKRDEKDLGKTKDKERGEKEA